MPNKNKSGKTFSEEIINKVWEKAEAVPGCDPQIIRKDRCGALLRRELFNHKPNPLSMGWEIDHIKPIAKGGTDDLVNLQPLQWENNMHKGDAYPFWKGRVGADGEANQYITD
jgi:hypothetical protein